MNGQKAWRVFSLKELRTATNNFNDDNIIGKGGFGTVYWGQLKDESQIAVKWLNIWNELSDKEFKVEVQILARVRHKNVLNLRGYCTKGHVRFLVCDYMRNLNLFSYLHGIYSDECRLHWGFRMSVAIGSAEGIAYLHHHAIPPMLHLHIKASNILLDANFQARVTDFGFPMRDIKGYRGYISPEHAMFGTTSESYVVYSFGILLLELASGKRPVMKVSSKLKRSITEWALPLVCMKKFGEIADLRLSGKYVDEEFRRIVLVALICTHSDPVKRPSMVDVVEPLKGEANEKFRTIESDKLFKCSMRIHLTGTSCVDDVSESFSKERESREK